MKSRRQFLIAGALSVLAVPYSVAQTRPRVGILAGIPREKSVATPLLLERLAELGYREGTNMSVEFRHAARDDRYPALAHELIGRKCDLIFAVANAKMARALRDARTSTPVVLLAVEYDPIESGIVASLARPGGNITGVFIPSNALISKRVEIAQELLPAANHYLVLADRFSSNFLVDMRRIADARGLRLTVVEFTPASYDLAAAFETGRKARVNAVFILLSAELIARQKELSALLQHHALPGFVSDAMSNMPGALASYSIDTRKFVRLAADMGARILRGAKPIDIPMEQPNEFSTVINLRTARALGIKVPQSVAARATRLIE